MILEDYDKFGATERTAGALQNILDYQGVVAPHTGEPFTEALLMGIGGGIGAEYATWAFRSLDQKEPRKARLYIRFHHVKNYVEKDEETAIRKITSRIGAKLTVRETSSREKAYGNLIESLKDGKPTIVYLSIWESLKIQREIRERFEQLPSIFGPPLNDEFVLFLPYYTLPYGWITGHLVVVYGIDEDAGLVHIADWSTQPLSITLKQLAEARAAIRGPQTCNKCG